MKARRHKFEFESTVAGKELGLLGSAAETRSGVRVHVEKLYHGGLGGRAFSALTMQQFKDRHRRELRDAVLGRFQAESERRAEERGSRG